MTMGVLGVSSFSCHRWYCATNLQLNTKPYRSRKIGSKALEHVLEAAKKHEKPRISTVYLHVQTSNDDAKRFYERHGFEQFGVAKDYYKKIEPRDALILEYNLHTEPAPVDGVSAAQGAAQTA